MALGGSLLKPHTALQQLLDEINFQRTKELRQLQREDGGFVVLQGTTYWTDLFVRHFLFQSETQHPIDSDDLLFFVRKKHIKGSSRHMPKFDTEIDVFRKDSRKLPIGDPDVDWEETVYLNLVIHQFDYTVTLAICTRTSPKELQVLRRHSQRVYASPSRRKMDTKGDSEEITYPHICFMVDNFDEVFSDILVRDGEMVCVELVASDRDGSVQGVIFLGSIRYDALKKVYDSRQSSLSTKVAQRMTFGLFSAGGPQTRCEFVRMKGPQGKGHAEMAVTKPKGSGVETPTSEPGISAADMWDSEWDEDPDDFYNYRHQRRLSDPSASLNNFSRYAFRTKGSHNATAGEKARSENEGLDILVNELSEIEAGDLRDDCPASSVSKTKIADGTCTAQAQATAIKATETAIITTPTTCCNCFANRKRWSDSLSMQMSDVYCRACDEGNLSPSCLVNVTSPWKFQKHGFNKNINTILNVENEIEIPSKKQNKKIKNSLSSNGCDGGGCSSANSKKCCSNKNQQQRTEKKQDKSNAAKHDLNLKSNKNNNKELEYELADDATFLTDNQIEINSLDGDIIKVGIMKEFDSKLMIRVQGQEEVPEIQHSVQILDNKQISNNCPSVRFNKYNNLMKLFKNDLNGNLGCSNNNNNNNHNNSTNNNSNHNDNNGIGLTRQYSTLPKRSKRQLNPYSNTDKLLSLKNQSILKVPTRITPDGTKIIYWCDMSKKTLKELDDGAYNPLWASKGFTQTFHFWKEHRRQQSTPLNAFLTYITLPWWSIAKDINQNIYIMETLYTGHIHGFTSSPNISYSAMGSTWGSQGGLVALGVVLGSSISLVGLAFAFITYSLFSDLRSLAGTTLLSLLASLFMGQLLFVIGVGGIQDQELCLSLSLALLYMKLASLCWLCCCCHQTLVVFRSNYNLMPTPEQKMGRRLAHYSLLSWGFPFLMVAVAAAFKYKEKSWRVTGDQVLAQIVQDVNSSTHCWLMEGQAFIWGFLVPAVILLFLASFLSSQAKTAATISAGLQVDSKAKSKMLKKRRLQIGLFVKLLVLISSIVLIGGIASIVNSPDMWAVYSIGQGVQGIITAMLVTCNCRILKLYTSSRGLKHRKGLYKSLQECEGGRYGVLSVTNPNYGDSDDKTFSSAVVSTESSDSNYIKSPKYPELDQTSFVKMTYREDIFIEKSDRNSNNNNNNHNNTNSLGSTKPCTKPVPCVNYNGEISGCLSLEEIAKKPPIDAV